MDSILTFKTFYSTPVNVERGGLLAWASPWLPLVLLVHRRHPDWSWPRCVWTVLWGSPIIMFADLGHAIAHTISAQIAGAPMDEIRVPMGMPRTLYNNNDVPPAVHRTRALGGPIFSGLMFGLSFLARSVLREGSAAREVATWSCIGHALIGLGSLMPFSIVDGGTILKWTLVEQGRTHAEADTVVEQTGLVVSGAAAAAGTVMATQRHWGWAVGLLGLALFGVGMAKGKIH